jgi:hypothetical protein
MSETVAALGGKQQKRGEGRSPAYPFISVQKALERAHELYAQESGHFAPLKSAVAAWGYSPKSSGARQTLATMRYYGLLDVNGEGDDRMIRVTELARKIILDKREDDSEKRALIRQVALMPTAHKALYQEYPNGLPSDGTVHHFLVFRKQYNDAAASELLAEFKQTASYVGLYEPRNSVDIAAEKEDKDPAKPTPDLKVGDRVQVTVGGQDMFADGATVLGFSDGGTYVFIDKADSGVRIEEVTLLEAAAEASAEERPRVPEHLLKPRQEEQPKGTRKAVFPLDDGDVTLIFPEGISPDGLAELGAYLDIFLKKEIKKKTA